MEYTTLTNYIPQNMNIESLDQNYDYMPKTFIDENQVQPDDIKTEFDIDQQENIIVYQDEDTLVDNEYTDLEVLDTDLLNESEEDSNAYVIVCSKDGDLDSCKQEMQSEDEIDDINEYSSEDDTQSEMEFRLKCNMKVIKLSVEEQVRDVQARKFKLFYKVAPFKCTLCFRGFDSEGEFTSHCNVSHNEDRKHQCELCFFRFKKEDNFDRHMTSHSRKYVCRKCYFVCRTKAVAYQHHRAHALEKLLCKYCGEMFNKFSLYLAHVRYLHPAKMKNCEVCAESFLTKNKLLSHMETHEVKKESDESHPFQAFHKPDSFLNSIIANEKRCNLCYKTFNTLAQFYAHTQSVHGSAETATTAAASVVDAVSAEITKSRKSTNSLLNIMCEVCGKIMKHQSTVKYHEKIHSGMRPFQCKLCPKTFPTSLQLDYHQYSHSDERPYPCTMCDKAFKLPSALQRHHKVHTGEKSYECPLCGKMFTQSFNVKFHVKTVHLKIPPPPRKVPRKNKQ